MDGILSCVLISWINSCRMLKEPALKMMLSELEYVIMHLINFQFSLSMRIILFSNFYQNWTIIT